MPCKRSKKPKKKKRRTRNLTKDLIDLSKTVVVATTAVHIASTLSGAIKKK